MTDGAGGRSRRPSPVAPDGPARSAATVEATAIRVAQLAGAKRIQADVSKALGLGLPLPSEIANLNAKYEAALDAFEAAWKEAHAVV